MNETLNAKVLQFIESRTMRQFFQDKGILFDGMDLLAIVSQSDYPIIQKVQFYNEFIQQDSLSKEEKMNAKRLLSKCNKVIDNLEIQYPDQVTILKLTGEYEGVFKTGRQALSYVQQEIYDLEEGLKFTLTSNCFERCIGLEVVDLNTNKVVTYYYFNHKRGLVYFDQNSEFDATLPEYKYVGFPNPFKKGDHVKGTICGK